MSIGSGSLRDFSLPDIFQVASLESLSGRLAIESMRWQGHVQFQAGQVVDAGYGDWMGEEAVYLLFTCEAGQFQFQAAPAGEVPSGPFRPMSEVIAEGLRRREAWKKLQEKHPNLSLEARVEPIEVPSPMVADEEAIRLLQHLEAGRAGPPGITVADLIHDLHLQEERVGQMLALLAERGVVRLIHPTEQGLQQLFNTVTLSLFEKFAGISGWRMVEGLVTALQQELDAGNNPPLQMHYKDQQLALAWLGSSLDSGQVDICRRLLSRQIEHIGKAHGNDFILRQLGDLYYTRPAAQQQLWTELGLPLPQPQSAKPA